MGVAGKKNAVLAVSFILFWCVSVYYAVMITSDDTGAPAVDSKDKLLAVLADNIAELNTKIYVNTQGIPAESADIDICDYFQNVLRARVNWWNYTADGRQYTYREYDITYSMYANVGNALRTGVTASLAPDEKQVYDKIKEIIAGYVKPGMSDYEKELSLHDYLVCHTAFDSSPANEAAWDSHTPYGALIKGAAVCNGYSDSFKLLMNAAGLECDIVYGEAVIDGVSQKHAWNRVKIGDGYYLADVAWDDAFPNLPGVAAYDYFNVTDEMISADHTPYARDKACTADEYNYFVYNNLLAHNQTDADNIIKRGLARGARVIYMRGAGFDVSRINFQALADYHQANNGISYSVNPRMNVMRIIL